MVASTILLWVAIAAWALLGQATEDAASVAGRGWGDEFDWISYQDGLKLADQTGKPMMLVFHRSTCGACKRLAPVFARSTKIAELAKQFVMVNVLTDTGKEEPTGPEFAPDGEYIPRILFQQNGQVLESLTNTAAQYKHFFSSEHAILGVMRRALGMEESAEDNENHAADDLDDDYSDYDDEDDDDHADHHVDHDEDISDYDEEDYNYSDYEDDGHEDL